MFERILVPLDRSPLAECVLPHAVAVARSLGSELVLLHILSRSDGQHGLRAVDPLEWQLRRAEAESYLEGVRATAGGRRRGADEGPRRGRCRADCGFCPRKPGRACRHQQPWAEWPERLERQQRRAKGDHARSLSLMIVRVISRLGRTWEICATGGSWYRSTVPRCRKRAAAGRHPCPRFRGPGLASARGAAPADAEANAAQSRRQQPGRPHRGAQPERGRAVPEGRALAVPAGNRRDEAADRQPSGGRVCTSWPTRRMPIWCC